MRLLWRPTNSVPYIPLSMCRRKLPLRAVMSDTLGIPHAHCHYRKSRRETNRRLRWIEWTEKKSRRWMRLSSWWGEKETRVSLLVGHETFLWGPLYLWGACHPSAKTLHVEIHSFRWIDILAKIKEVWCSWKGMIEHATTKKSNATTLDEGHEGSPLAKD